MRMILGEGLLLRKENNRRVSGNVKEKNGVIFVWRNGAFCVHVHRMRGDRRSDTG